MKVAYAYFFSIINEYSKRFFCYFFIDKITFILGGMNLITMIT